MDSLIHADIFFFVTTAVVLLLGVGFIVLLIYLIRIIRDAERITASVRRETDAVIRDIDALRDTVKEEGLRWKHVRALLRKFSFFTALGAHSRKDPKRASHGKSRPRRAPKRTPRRPSKRSK